MTAIVINVYLKKNCMQESKGGGGKKKTQGDGGELQKCF